MSVIAWVFLVLLGIVVYFLYRRKEELRAMITESVKLGTELGTEKAIESLRKKGHSDDEIREKIKK